MTGKTKYDVEKIHEWRLRAKSLRLGQKLSMNQICRQIANESHVPFGTVRYHVLGYGRKFDDKNYSQEYDSKYQSLIHYLDKLLPQFFNGNSELSLTELTGRIESHVGISMRETTLEKLIGKY